MSTRQMLRPSKLKIIKDIVNISKISDNKKCAIELREYAQTLEVSKYGNVSLDVIEETNGVQTEYKMTVVEFSKYTGYTESYLYVYTSIVGEKGLVLKKEDTIYKIKKSEV